MFTLVDYTNIYADVKEAFKCISSSNPLLEPSSTVLSNYCLARGNNRSTVTLWVKVEF